MRTYITLRRFIENKENLDKNGIYKIYHLSKPNIYYIGSTYRTHKKLCKRGFYGRWIEHFSRLNRKIHHSKYLQNVINKYGIEDLRFEIVEIIEDKTKIRGKELYYISLFNSYKNGYNSTDETNHQCMSEEDRTKASIRMKLNNPMKDKKNRNKMITSKKINYRNIILQYNLEGNFIKEWNSIQEASTGLKIHDSNIFRALSRETKSSGNFLWFYKDEFSEELLTKKIQDLKKIYKPSKETIAKMVLKIIKKVYVFNKNNELIQEFRSIADAAKFYNIDSGNISKCCNGKQKTYKNMIFKFNN